MTWEKWPLYVQKRYALGKAQLKDPSRIICGPFPQTDEICAEEVVNWIYGVLTTLDAKASALMRLNGVLIAAAAFLLGLFGRQGEAILSTRRLDAVVIILLAVLSAVSIFLCLFVVRVSWPFLGKVIKNDDKTFDFANEIACLDQASAHRQWIYQCAWSISAIASFGFVFEFLRQAVHVLCPV